MFAQILGMQKAAAAVAREQAITELEDRLKASQIAARSRAEAAKHNASEVQKLEERLTAANARIEQLEKALCQTYPMRSADARMSALIAYEDRLKLEEHTRRMNRAYYRLIAPPILMPGGMRARNRAGVSYD